MKILFVLPRSPWPPYAGQARLAFHRAIGLRQLGHDVVLFAYGYQIPVEDVLFELKSASAYSGTYIYSFKLFSLFLLLLTSLRFWFFNALPLIALLYTPSFVVKRLERCLSAERFDIVHFYSINSYPLWVIATRERIPFVVDLVDSMSLNLLCRSSSIPTPLNWLFKKELNAVELFESNLPILDYCYAFLTVGLSDLNRLSLSLNHLNPNVPIFQCHSIGVELPALCSQQEIVDRPFSILFFGSLYYQPNIEAITWFVQEVCPILAHYIDFTFVIAGSKPTRFLIDLDQKLSYVNLISNPHDMSSVISTSAITVAPMRSGSGQQFKVLESIAYSTPVVSTSLAANPLNLCHDIHLLVADTPFDFAVAIKTLLSDRALYDRLAISGRDFVQSCYSWDAKSMLLAQMYSNSVSSNYL